MALAEKRICEHTDATTISSADEFIVDSMANGTRNITMTNLENQILSTDTYSALSGIGDGTITGSIADIDSNLNNLTYDSTTNRLTMTGNTAFSGTIDSVPTAGSGNAVSSGGTKTYVDSAVSQLNDEIAVNKDELITENWTSGKITDTNKFTLNGFTGTITDGWVFYSKSNSAIIINIFIYITNAVFTNRNNPYIDIKLPVKSKYSFDRVFAGVFGTGATVQAVYGRRAEDAYITVNANSDTIRLTKHNFVQGATDGAVVILTPEIIIPIV